MKKLITSLILIILISEILFANVSCAANTWDDAFEGAATIASDSIEIMVRKRWTNTEC